MTPIGGKYLADMRLAGKRPPGAVWVTDHREVARRVRDRIHSYALIVDFEQTYDMRLLHGLDVALWTETPRQKAAGVCQAILEADPRSFTVTFIPEEMEWVIHVPR